MIKEGSFEKVFAFYQVLRQPPQYVLFDKWFEIEIGLDKSISKLRTDTTNRDNDFDSTEDLPKPPSVDIELIISRTKKKIQDQDDANEGLPILVRANTFCFYATDLNFFDHILIICFFIFFLGYGTKLTNSFGW